MNLLARQTALLPGPVAQAVNRSRARPDEITVESRDALPVNGLVRNGRQLLFHSRYAAAQEAARIAESTARAGCVVVLGLGMGHHLLAMARQSARIVCVEPDPALVRSALELTDLTGLLRSGRLVIVTSVSPDVLIDSIASSYVPALHGPLICVGLPGRLRAEPDRMSAARDAVSQAFESIRNDLAVQARFGRQWTRNAILNLIGANVGELPDFHGMPVVVAAAGPSLEDAMHEVAAPGVRIIAVDTALPVLTGYGVRPDVVLTVDCQSVSYHHYLAACLPDVQTVADLSASTSVFTHMRSVLPVLTDHPLHTLFRRLGYAAPYVDARGGNVTQAAVDLAVRCGAQEVRLVGADYSYPGGAAYARGSYLHRLFAAKASRLTPQETRHHRFIMERPGVHRDPEQPTRLLHPLLSQYASSMVRFAESLPVALTRRQDRGVDLRLARARDEPDGDRPASRTIEPARRPEPPRAVLAEAARLFREIRHPRALQAALDAGSEPASFAARALLPFLTHLAATDPHADPAMLVHRATDETTELLEAAIARVEIS